MVNSQGPDPIKQLCLFSLDELRRMQRLVPRLREAEAAPREAPCRNIKEHVAKKDDYIRDALPDL